MRHGIIAVLVAGVVFGPVCCMRAQAQTETPAAFENSVRYYQRLKATGADLNNRIAVLERIMQKYARTPGVDLGLITRELDQLRAEKRQGGALQASREAPGGEEPRAITRKDYVIDVGDLLSIMVYPAEEFSREIVVQPDGQLSMPMIGSVRAKGQTKESLSMVLVDRLKVYVANPEVSIIVKRFSRRQIFLTGEVKRTGAVDYVDDVRLLQMVTQGGGFTKKADLRDIKVYRGDGLDREVFKLNLEEVFATGDFARDFQLQPGDVVEVGKREMDVYVIGEVNAPGAYEYQSGEKVLEVIVQARGFTDDALAQRVRIFRGVSPAIEVFEVDMVSVLDRNMFELDILLQPGDTIYVPQKRLSKATWFLAKITPWFAVVNFILLIAVLS